MKTVLLPSARTDILRQVGYFIEIGQERIADRFLAATRTAIEHVAETPKAGPPKILKDQRLEGLRTWSIEGFDDMKIYYLVRAEELAVVRILHGRQDIERILER